MARKWMNQINSKNENMSSHFVPLDGTSTAHYLNSCSGECQNELCPPFSDVLVHILGWKSNEFKHKILVII